MKASHESQEVVPLEALEALFTALGGEGVRFCHWKSNAHLATAVRGETDLDLLVDRRHSGRFRAVVDEHDFKPLIAAPGKHYPAVENYLGFDAATGKLIHLHVHYQLVLGQQFVKDYRLPIEDWILDSVRDLGGVPVPAPEVELTILTMRVALKYRLRDAIKDMAGYRSPGIPARIRTELGWLADQTSRDEIRHIAQIVPEVPTTVPHILDLVLDSERAGRRLLRLRQRLRDELRPFRRISRMQSTMQYATAITRKRSRSLGVGEKHRMTLRNGGISVGFVGADGAGKSTIVGAVQDWLGWRLDVSTSYMGTSQPHGSVRVLKEVAGAAKSADRRIHRRSNGRGPAAAATRRISLGLMGIRRLGEARSKRSRQLSAGDMIARGSVVLYDRFPLPDVAVLGRSMDGPRLDQEIGEFRSSVLRRMVEREAETYRDIRLPDRLIALQVSPEVSMARKPDHDPASIEAKASAIQQLAGHPDRFAAIDADRPYDEVLAEVKATVWSWL